MTKRDRLEEMYRNMFGAVISPSLGIILAMHEMASNLFVTNQCDTDDAKFLREQMRFVREQGHLPD